ncbi:MAG TPA: protoporphyrinogen oxidase [Planctomycetes bacterium]|nr:protoporphyrinogen oxidase [Planctomycetota bacterium]
MSGQWWTRFVHAAESGKGCRIAVVGGGISGLSAAHHARDLGADVHLFEASHRPGGWIRTTRQDQWTLEWGPHSVLPSSSSLIQLIDRVGLTSSLRSAEPGARARYIWRRGALRKLPSSPLAIPFSRALSPVGWARLLMEPFIRRGGVEEETVHAFFRRRFGEEAARILADAMVAGSSGGWPQQLEVDSFQPLLRQWEQQHGSVLAGLLRQPAVGGAPFSGPGTLADGMDSLPHAMAAELGDRFHGGSPVEALEPAAEGWKVHYRGAYASNTVEVDGIILALPAPACAALLAPVSDRSRAILESIPYASLSLVQIGYDARKWRASARGFGFLAPRSEKLGVLGAIWSSSLFPFRAPPQHGLTTVFLAGKDDTDGDPYSDKILVERSLDAMRKVHGPGLEVELALVGRAPAAIPQATRGHRRRIDRLQHELRSLPALALSGSYLDGISLESCVRSGQDAVVGLLDRWKSSQESI